ncbi:hypothetical protein HW509_10625 [Asaia spathodeae]|uniref:hypothetical protein n=1 Tax=Asaia spathodeae TaxID=657016 RepID=UPI002FC2B5A9
MSASNFSHHLTVSIAEAIRQSAREEAMGNVSPDALARAIVKRLPSEVFSDRDVQWAGAAIKSSADISEDSENIISVCLNKSVISDLLSLVVRDALSRAPNGVISGHFNSLCNCTCAGKLPTPPRTDDALPLKHAASVTVFPSEAKGERP